MGKTRNIYMEGTKVKSCCRICLTQSNNLMFKLTDPFPLKAGNFEAETYLDALEQVTYTKVVIGGNYPEGICPMCVSFLKMTLEFVKQFKKSQKQLQKMSKSSIPAYESISVECKYSSSSNEEDDYFTDDLHCDQENSSNVELIIKNKKFNLNEVLVVEDTEKKVNNFGGFIKNLGKEISATVINNKSLNNFPAIKPDPEVVVKNEPMEQNSDENDDCNDGEETIEFIVESLEEYDDQGTFETFSADKNEEAAQSEEIKIIEDNSSDADSQKSEIKKLEYIEIDMFDKEAIESLIIDRSKLSDNNRIAVTRKGKSKDDDRDEFLKQLKFPCEICKNVYQTKYSLKGHMRRAHSNRNEKTFTCDICGTECRTRSVFVNHKLKHFDKKFKCETCGKAYSTKAHLKVHMTAHSNIRPYLCNVCGKDFNYANALTYHMRLHTGEKNYHCEYCPKRFRMINALNRHLRTHTGEKPYKCQFCGRDFSSRGEVVCHEYIHTGYRPYHCKYCKKGFSKTHNLKIHLLSHGGPYHCQFCNKTFIEENILTMHHKISHKDMMTDEQTENADEDTPDSQDGAYIPYEDFSQDGNVEIELIEENSELEDRIEDDNSSE